MAQERDDELGRMDATAQAAWVARGEGTPSDLVEAAIARIERHDPALNAVIHPLFDKARAAAASADLPGGPFRGVPFLVKDAVCQTEGDPYHLGMRALKERGYRADHDTELARRFRAAGFVFVGKTNTPELALSVTTEPLAYGASHNPWNLEHSTGGSSGGAAAAVAAGLVPAAHANDMGGSIRIPASFCGLVGLKPTRARGTLAPDYGEFWGPLTHEHVVTRSVRDSAGVLDAISGPAPGDPYTAPRPLRPFRSEIGAPPGRLRIGVAVDAPEATSDPACRSVVERTAARLEELGHEVEEMELPGLEGMDLGPWIPVAVAHGLDRWSELLGDPIDPAELEPANQLFVELGRGMSAVDLMAGADRAFAWSRRAVRPFAEGLDLLMTPTAPSPPPPLGVMAPDVPVPELLRRLGRMTAFTAPFNVTGQPAISLPLGRDEGLPIGVQFVADTGREDVRLRLASQLEEAFPWADDLPRLPTSPA